MLRTCPLRQLRRSWNERLLQQKKSKKWTEACKTSELHWRIYEQFLWLFSSICSPTSTRTRTAWRTRSSSLTTNHAAGDLWPSTTPTQTTPTLACHKSESGGRKHGEDCLATYSEHCFATHSVWWGLPCYTLWGLSCYTTHNDFVSPHVVRIAMANRDTWQQERKTSAGAEHWN